MQNLFPFTQRKKRACSLLKMTRASLGPAYPVSVYLQALPGQDGSSMQLSGAWWEVVAEFELAGFVQEHLRIPWDVCFSSTSSCPVQISQHKQILLPGWRRRGDDSPTQGCVRWKSKISFMGPMPWDEVHYTSFSLFRGGWGGEIEGVTGFPSGFHLVSEVHALVAGLYAVGVDN